MQAELGLIDGDEGWPAPRRLRERCEEGKRSQRSIGEVVDIEAVVPFVLPEQAHR
jgi:hypothetical protein